MCVKRGFFGCGSWKRSSVNRRGHVMTWYTLCNKIPALLNIIDLLRQFLGYQMMVDQVLLHGIITDPSSNCLLCSYCAMQRLKLYSIPVIWSVRVYLWLDYKQGKVLDIFEKMEPLFQNIHLPLFFLISRPNCADCLNACYTWYTEVSASIYCCLERRSELTWELWSHLLWMFLISILGSWCFVLNNGLITGQLVWKISPLII